MTEQPNMPTSPTTDLDASSRHPRLCRATRTDGQPCEAWAIQGARVCRVHGGSLKRTKAAAAKRVAEAEAIREVRRRTAQNGPLTIEDVYDNLAKFAGSLSSWEEVLAEKLDAMGDQLTYTDVQGVERAKEITEMWRRAINQGPGKVVG